MATRELEDNSYAAREKTPIEKERRDRERRRDRDDDDIPEAKKVVSGTAKRNIREIAECFFTRV